MPTSRADAQLQLAVGLFDLWIWAALVWAFGVAGCASIDPLFGVIGWAGCGVAPIGLVEVGLSVHVLRGADPRWSRRLAGLQMASILIGGVPAAVVGFVVWTRSRAHRSSTSR